MKRRETKHMAFLLLFMVWVLVSIPIAIVVGRVLGWEVTRRVDRHPVERT